MPFNSVSLVELIYSTTGIDKLLLAREKRMTLAADFHFDGIGFLRRTRFEGFAASAHNRNLVIIGMYVFLHKNFSSLNSGAHPPLFSQFLKDYIIFFPFSQQFERG